MGLLKKIRQRIWQERAYRGRLMPRSEPCIPQNYCEAWMECGRVVDGCGGWTVCGVCPGHAICDMEAQCRPINP